MVKRTLFLILSLSLLVIPAAAQRALTKPETGTTPQELLQDRQVSVTLNDGSVIDGLLLNINGDAFALQIKKGTMDLMLSGTSVFAFKNNLPGDILATLPYSSSSVSMILRTDVSRDQAGQTLIATVMVSGGLPISHAEATLKFDPQVLTLSDVRGGGLFRSTRVSTAIVEQNGIETVTATDGCGPDCDLAANGRLFIYTFTVNSAGDPELTIDPSKSSLSPNAGPAVPLTVIYGKVLTTE
ncbi:MAG TPA: cohesin domain-containing protein [Blastocatellia bacterium]|nr:cohesin domain-containing protein [Blastocatellia bacterium]